MIEKVKNFVKEHRKGFLVGGILFASAVTAGLVYGRTKTNEDPEDVMEEYCQITWKPNNTFMSLENAKAVIDANADNNSSYAIFREGPKKEEYVCIMLNDDEVVIP